MTPVFDYRPSAYYFRSELYAARTRAEVLEIALQAVMEMENLRAFIRENGLIPPKQYVLCREAQEKGWDYFSEGSPSEISISLEAFSPSDSPACTWHAS